MSVLSTLKAAFNEAGSRPLLSLAGAARLFPGEAPDTSISPGTVYRWGTRGLALSGGRIVKLKIWRVGRKFVTTSEAIAEFIEAQQRTADETSCST